MIPTRSRSFLFADLIESILTQDFKDFEIVVADNSEDLDTQNLIHGIKDSRIKNLRTGNLNMADNWEKGLNEAKGKNILLFSDKMVLKKGALKYLHNYINKHKPECITWTIDSYYDQPDIYFKRELEKE